MVGIASRSVVVDGGASRAVLSIDCSIDRAALNRGSLGSAFWKQFFELIQLCWVLGSLSFGILEAIV